MALGLGRKGDPRPCRAGILRVYTRARDLLDDTVPAKEQMAVLYGLFSVTFFRGDDRGREARGGTGPRRRGTGTRPGGHRVRQSHDGHCGLGDRRFPCGCAATRQVAELYAAGSGNVTDLRYSQDHSSLVAVSAGAGSVAARLCGSSDRSGFKALARAQQINHAMTTAFALIFGSTLCEFIRADPLRGGHLFDEALDYCVNKDLRTYFPWSRFYGGLSLINRGQLDQGLEMMRGAMAAAKKINTKLLWTPHLGSLALAHVRAGQAEAALDLLSEALAAVEDMDERCVRSRAPPYYRRCAPFDATSGRG